MSVIGISLGQGSSVAASRQIKTYFLQVEGEENMDGRGLEGDTRDVCQGLDLDLNPRQESPPSKLTRCSWR